MILLKLSQKRLIQSGDVIRIDYSCIDFGFFFKKLRSLLCETKEGSQTDNRNLFSCLSHLISVESSKILSHP